MDALTSPKAPKHTQIFTKKREAPVLFYKFYKFRRDLLFSFNALPVYRLQIRTYRLQIRTYRLQIRIISAIYRLHLVTYRCSHGKDNRSGC